MAEESSLQSEWNFDGAQLFYLFTLKTNAASLLDSWKLEESYWAIRAFNREIDAKLKDSERTKIIEHLNEIADLRNKYIQLRQVNHSDRAAYYIVLESLYIYLCRLLKAHGLYYREKADPTKAALMS